MNLLNLSHPLTEQQLADIAALAGVPVARVVAARVQFDAERGFAEQTAELLAATGVAPDEWQTAPWLVVLPALNFIAAVVLAELHGRMGHFPAIVRLRPIPGAATTYAVAEILDLEQVRLTARQRR